MATSNRLDDSRSDFNSYSTPELSFKSAASDSREKDNESIIYCNIQWIEKTFGKVYDRVPYGTVFTYVDGEGGVLWETRGRTNNKEPNKYSKFTYLTSRKAFSALL